MLFFSPFISCHVVFKRMHHYRGVAVFCRFASRLRACFLGFLLFTMFLAQDGYGHRLRRLTDTDRSLFLRETFAAFLCLFHYLLLDSLPFL